ncbi:NUDIX domain-containing protein [Haloarchaeobius sp. DFWS5]|uniref:NUDIX domain-containing protein n=1 Tax=Haloarchaeobius sp. DFWS5 TaxID=3446114 RepID=UPI003EBA2EB2
MNDESCGGEQASDWSTSEETAEWPVRESTVEYDCGWFRAGRDRVDRPDGETVKHHWVESDADAVAVVAVTDDDEVVLVEQYRPTFRERCAEVPAGMVEPGESYEEAARRELEEETGYRAQSVELLETYRPIGIGRMGRAVVVATGLTAGEQAAADASLVDVETVPTAEAFSRVRDDGGPTTGWSLTALSLAQVEGYW